MGLFESGWRGHGDPPLCANIKGDPKTSPALTTELGAQGGPMEPEGLGYIHDGGKPLILPTGTPKNGECWERWGAQG